jgi:hypothetical protein
MDESILAQEKLIAIERYADLRQRGHSRDTAAAFLAASTAFPLLSTVGKHGRSALSAHNLDNWSRIARSGRSLLRNWTRGSRPCLPGGGSFWSAFFCLYLKPTRLSVSVAYRRAAKLARRGDSPTVTQCQRVIKKRVDPVLMALCRGEPLPAMESKPATPAAPATDSPKNHLRERISR